MNIRQDQLPDASIYFLIGAAKTISALQRTDAIEQEKACELIADVLSIQKKLKKALSDANVALGK